MVSIYLVQERGTGQPPGAVIVRPVTKGKPFTLTRVEGDTLRILPRFTMLGAGGAAGRGEPDRRKGTELARSKPV
jgi:hypothetical protein